MNLKYWKIIRKKLYGIIKAPGRGLEKLVMYDEKGNKTIEPTNANRFFATFSSSDDGLENFTILVAVRDVGQNSHIDIKTPTLGNDQDFSLVRDLVSHIRSAVGLREGIAINWQDFDKTIDPREEAMNNIKESKDIGKFFGTTKSSFQRIGDAKLIIRHTDSINEEKNGARTRHIKAMFIENKIGERFSYPYPHIAGARAFARHISNGGTNHDKIAEKIFSLSEDYMSLKRTGNQLRMTTEASDLITGIRESMSVVNKSLKSMQGPKGYQNACNRILEEDETQPVDEGKVTELKTRLAEYCSCGDNGLSPSDLDTAASYLSRVQAPMIQQQPITFTWARRPNLNIGNMSGSAADRLYQQISELANACTNEAACSKLRSIAEMIASGGHPTEEELDVVREAVSSGMSFVQEDDMLHEEKELTEFLSSFELENIFSEDQEVDYLEATGMDKDDAEQEAHDNPDIKEWDTDPGEEQAARAEALEASIESHLADMGVQKQPMDRDSAEHVAHMVSKAMVDSDLMNLPYGANVDNDEYFEEVMKYLENHDMISYDMNVDNNAEPNMVDKHISLETPGDVINETQDISRIKKLAGLR
jgi:hypothetical protein